MKKIYLSLSLTFFAGLGFTQNINKLDIQQTLVQPKSVETNSEVTFVDGIVERGSAFWSEDFANGLAGTLGAWTVGETDGALWKHNLSGPSGCWSFNTATPATTSAANGFMLFDADSANCADASTQSMTNPIVDFIGSLISPDIDVSGQTDILLTFEQSFRFCCAASINLNVYISNNGGSTWSTPINVSYGQGVNAQSANPQTVSINITNYALSSSNLKIKFEWNSEGHYYWAIDDVSLSVPENHDVRLMSGTFWNATRDLVFDVPLDYTIVPVSQLDDIVLRGNIDNQGINTAVNANLAFSVENVATTVVGTGNSTPANLNSTFSRLDSATYVPLVTPDTYTMYVEADHDDILLEANTTDNNRTAGRMQVVPNTGSIIQWARDNNTENGGFYDLNADPYIIGNVFLVNNDITVHTIDAAFMGGTGATEVGATFSVVLYEMNPAATQVADVFEIVYSGALSGYDYTVTAPMIGTSTTTVWNKIPLNPLNPEVGITLQAGKQYLAAVESFGGPDYLSMAISGATPDSESSVWLYGNGGTQGTQWYYSTTKMKIRLGIDGTVGIGEEIASNNLTLGQNMPNPAGNTTSIGYTLNESANVSFEIVDLTGKVIYSENMGNKGAGIHNLNINTTDFASGIYFYSMTAGNEKLTNKMLIEK